jgi:copper/silver efflux system protein
MLMQLAAGAAAPSVCGAEPGQLAQVTTVTGPSTIRNENGLLVGYVYVDITGRDGGGHVDDAKRAVAAAVKLPPGYALEWSGQYEGMQRVTERLKAKGWLRSMAELHEAIVHGAVKRLRPKMTTVPAAMIGLMPITWSIGTGADVMTADT